MIAAGLFEDVDLNGKLVHVRRFESCSVNFERCGEMASEVETMRFQPDYRLLGRYQFVTGYTGGGAEMCVHLTFVEIAARLRERHGDGRLVDDGTDLIWLQPADVGIPKLANESLTCSSL